MNKVILFLEQQTEESINQLSYTVFYTTRVENKSESPVSCMLWQNFLGTTDTCWSQSVMQSVFIKIGLLSLWVNPINKMIIYFNAHVLYFTCKQLFQKPLGFWNEVKPWWPRDSDTFLKRSLCFLRISTELILLTSTMNMLFHTRKLLPS